MPPEPLTLSGVDIPPYPYGWYYNENGNLVNGETGETFWDIPWETQDLFYREVLGGVYLSGNLGQDNIEPAIDNLSTEVGRWLDSEELYQWAEAEAKQRWENQVMQNIPPQSTADPITPETHVIAPWDGGGREPTSLALLQPLQETWVQAPDESHTTTGAPVQGFASPPEDRNQAIPTPPTATPTPTPTPVQGLPFRVTADRALPSRGNSSLGGAIRRKRANQARPETPGGREDRFTTQRVSKPPAPKELFPGFGRRGIR